MLDSEKREIIKRLIRTQSAMMSNQRIAWIVGCELKVVSQIRKVLLDSEELHRHKE